MAQVTRGVGPTGEWVAWAGAGAHRKHVRHVRDAGRVEAQRLVERIRVLLSAKGGRLGGRQAGQEAEGRGGGSPSDAQHGPDWSVVARAGAERTRNMYAMSVTLEVSKVSGWLNACAYCRVQRGAWEAGDMQSAEACGWLREACGGYPAGGLGRRRSAPETCTACS